MDEDERPPIDRDFQLGDVVVRPGRHRLERGGRAARVEPRVMAVLADLAAAAPDTVPRERLLAAHWPPHVTDDALNRALWKLRRAFAELGDPDEEWIETVPKKGYRLRVAPTPSREDAGGPVEPPRRSLRMVTAAAALVALSAVAVGLRLRDSPPAPTPAAPSAVATPLTALPGYESSPTFAGGRWVFAHYEKEGERAQQWDLFVRRADGREERLTDTPEHEFGPDWSPDGATLAYVRATDTSCEIVLRSDGGRERVFGCGPDDGGPRDVWAHLTWAADGTLVVSDRRRRGGPRRLRRLDPASGRTTILTDPPSQSAGDSWPAVSPDGGRVAFVRSRSAGREDLWVRDLASGAERRLTYDVLPVAGVAWSADGGSLTYSSRRGGTYRLWRLPASGGEPQPVPAVGRNLTGPRPAPGGLTYEEWQSRINLWRLEIDAGAAAGRPWIESVRWSWMPAADPAGGRVAFLSDRDGAVEVWLAETASGAVRRVTDLDLEVVPRLSWSPDGASIVLDFPAQGSYDLHLLDPATGSVERLTEDASDERVPVFAPDGRSIVFASDREDGWQLWSLDRSSGAIERRSAAGGFAATPSPDGRWLYLVRRDEAGIWRRPSAAGADVEAELWVEGFPAADWPAWTVVDAGVVFLARDPGGPAELRLRDEAGVRVLAVVEEPGGPLHEVWTESSLVADAGLRHFVLASLDRSESDLWLLPMPRD